MHGQQNTKNVVLTFCLLHNVTSVDIHGSSNTYFWSHLHHGLTSRQKMNKTLHSGQRTSPHLGKATLNQRLRVALPSTTANSCKYSMVQYNSNSSIVSIAAEADNSLDHHAQPSAF
jgi:hypothetical protein